MKERVDQLLVSRNLVESREAAKRLVMAGEVFVGTERVAKASTKTVSYTHLTLPTTPYV